MQARKKLPAMLDSHLTDWATQPNFVNHKFTKYALLCKFWGFNSSVIEDLSLLGCDTVWLGKWFGHFGGMH
jgi:hypothetical protein